MSVVSGETVRGDKESLVKFLGQYSSQVGDLGSSWEGTSHDAFVKAATEFTEECNKISVGMDAFASACDKYNNEYLNEKAAKKEREARLAEAQSNNTNGQNDGPIANYKKDIASHEENMKRIKGEIVELLKTASSSKIKGASSFMLNGNLKFGDGTTVGGNYVLLNVDLGAVAKKFGSQLDNKGLYGYDSVGCDDYARAYCIFAQTGIAPNKRSVSVSDSKSGLTAVQKNPGSRKGQAQLAYDLLVKEGKPCVIHINSPSTGSGKGHWVTVVGVKKGVTRDNVKIDDFIIIDPVTGSVRKMTEDKEYCRTDTRRCSADPGYHVNYYV